jgi:hypothetical protein
VTLTGSFAEIKLLSGASVLGGLRVIRRASEYWSLPKYSGQYLEGVSTYKIGVFRENRITTLFVFFFFFFGGVGFELRTSDLLGRHSIT